MFNIFNLDRISRHIPPQPVYSEEMSEKIEKEEEKLRTFNSIDNARIFGHKSPFHGQLWYNQGRTNSTFLLKQPNSLEVDRGELRKTKSDEFMGFVAPKIIIGELQLLLTADEASTV